MKPDPNGGRYENNEATHISHRSVCPSISIRQAETDYIILDVRTEDEYNTGHVPKAICLPYDAISQETTSEFKTDQLILVYCRSGNRSKKACASLSDLGFTNVVDFGGIGDWTGKIVK